MNHRIHKGLGAQEWNRAPRKGRSYGVTSSLVLLVLGLAMGASIASAQAEYDFILVEAFNAGYDLREVYMRDLNASGTACGTSTYEGSYGGFIWTEATDKELVPIVWPSGLNNLSQVVGESAVYNYDTGETVYVPPVGWPLVRLLDINDNGIAVGYAECNCSNSDGVIQNDLIWDAQGGSRSTGIEAARELVRINNLNVAVGNIRPSAGSSEAYVYDLETGQHTNLSDLLPEPPFVRPWSEASDINESNVVAGVGYDGVNVKGMVWSEEASFTFLPALDGGDPTRVHPLGINNHDIVVGRGLSGTTGNWDAFIWDAANGMRNLNDLVDAPGAFTLDWATAINDAGWIIGIGHFGPGWGTARGFVLKPTVPADAADDSDRPRPGFAVLPNPFVDRASVQMRIARTGPVTLQLYDASGRSIASPVDRAMSAGIHEVDLQMGAFPAGVYFLRLEQSGSVSVRRIVRTR